MHHPMESSSRRRRAPIVRAGLAFALALLGLAACGQIKGNLGESCTVYATSPDCQKGLECSCRQDQGGCVCALPCGGEADGGSACPQGTTCVTGRNPAINSSAYFCFPHVDGGT